MTAHKINISLQINSILLYVPSLETMFFHQIDTINGDPIDQLMIGKKKLYSGYPITGHMKTGSFEYRII